MIFIGIDIAKNSHFASAVNSDNEVIVKPFNLLMMIKGLIYLLILLKILICHNWPSRLGIYRNLW